MFRIPSVRWVAVLLLFAGTVGSAVAASTENTVTVSATIETPSLSGTSGGTSGGSTGGGEQRPPSGLRPPSIIEKILSTQTNPPPAPHGAAIPPVPTVITIYNPVLPAPPIVETPAVPGQKPDVRPAANVRPAATGIVECLQQQQMECSAETATCNESIFSCIAATVESAGQTVFSQYPTLENLRATHPVELGMWLFLLLVLGFFLRTILLAFLSLWAHDDHSGTPASPMMQV